jgi:uncharacterized protein YjiS (DUF1127 family)
MEMTMSTISSAPNTAQGILAPAGLGWLRATLTRCWMTYLTWRIEQAAITQLELMDDRELRDIGLTRSSITRAVRVEPARDRAFIRSY